MRVETVRGAMAVDGLGTTLMHEHVFVLTPDVMQNYGHEWDEQDQVADAVRQLQALKDAGVDGIVEPTVMAWAATYRGCSGSTSSGHQHHRGDRDCTRSARSRISSATAARARSWTDRR